jgi:hypothetical protein
VVSRGVTGYLQVSIGVVRLGCQGGANTCCEPGWCGRRIRVTYVVGYCGDIRSAAAVSEYGQGYVEGPILLFHTVAIRDLPLPLLLRTVPSIPYRVEIERYGNPA